MPSRHLTLRIDADAFDRLDAESRRLGQSRSDLAKTLLGEGLRMEAHPGIVFRGGPAGRRAGLAAGPDVWEVVRVFKSVEASGEEAVAHTAELSSLSLSQIRTVLRYYAEYQDEIDAWLQRVDDEARRAEAAWRREQKLLSR
jgi:hypothetical protein